MFKILTPLYPCLKNIQILICTSMILNTSKAPEVLNIHMLDNLMSLFAASGIKVPIASPRIVDCFEIGFNIPRIHFYISQNQVTKYGIFSQQCLCYAESEGCQSPSFSVTISVSNLFHTTFPLFAEEQFTRGSRSPTRSLR